MSIDTSEEKWKNHLYRTGSHTGSYDEVPDNPEQLRKQIEPWLSAVFQSEHLSLLLGNGFGIGVSGGKFMASMGISDFDGPLAELVKQAASRSAKCSERGVPNFEDNLRVANELLRGLEILADPRSTDLQTQIGTKLQTFLKSVLESERDLLAVFDKGDPEANLRQNLLMSFLLSFASRTPSRERLNLFTTNYDRLIEYGCDQAGLRIMDRFVGMLSPVFRASRMNLDFHYNPPGIRGEPRYLEGVIRLFKLHGSIDWRQLRREIRRQSLPFGAPDNHPAITMDPSDGVIIYPNSAKDMETSEYPYAELFRDFAAATCRPNSVLVTYGYGFGDDHVNRVIRDMLTIPSTHVVIISYDNPGKRVESFCDKVGHKAQISLLIGSHFGEFQSLVVNYLPKPAIDLISSRKTELLQRRGDELLSTPDDATVKQGAGVGGNTNANTN